MATYRLDYVADCGRTFKAASVTMRRFNEATGFESTQPDYDDRWMPLAFRAELQPGRPICDLPMTPRAAIAWIAATQYMVIPLPWPGDRPEFLEAFQQINALSGVVLVTLVGETLTAGYTGLLY